MKYENMIEDMKKIQHLLEIQNLIIEWFRISNPTERLGQYVMNRFEPFYNQVWPELFYERDHDQALKIIYEYIEKNY